MIKHTLESVYFWSKELDFSYPLAIKKAREFLEDQIQELNQEIQELENDKFLTKDYEEVDRFVLEHFQALGNSLVFDVCRYRAISILNRKIEGYKKQLEGLSKVDYSNAPRSQDKIDVEDLKSRVDIENIGLILGLKKRNGMYFSIFKDEKRPSMKLYQGTNTFVCFATGEKGDVISLVQKTLNTDFITALKWLQSNS